MHATMNSTNDETKWAFRLGYVAIKAVLVGAVALLPKTILHARPEAVGGGEVPIVYAVAAIVVLTTGAFAVLQNSDPGYLTEDLVRRMMMTTTDEEDAHLGSTEEEEDDIVEEKTGQEEEEVGPRRAIRPPGGAERAYRLARLEEIRKALHLEMGRTSGVDEKVEGIAEEEKEKEKEEEGDTLLLLPNAERTKHETESAFCVDCEIVRPLRSHHCRRCRRCVATFDHHCFVLGTCIGERNHARFWWFLLLQTLELGVGIHIAQSGLRSSTRTATWSQVNGLHVLVLSLLVCILVFVGALLGFHTFLAMGSMTTYEFGHGPEHFSYLRGFRECDLPFSRGLIRNLAHFCCQPLLFHPVTMACAKRREASQEGPWIPMHWHAPSHIERDSEAICQNLWENKYYSCC